MVDREHRRNAVARQKQEVSRLSNMRVELRAAVENDDDYGNGTPKKFFHQHVGPIPVESLVPEGDPGVLPCLTIATHTTGVNTTGTAGDTMVTETSVTTLSEKTETTSTEEIEGEVGRSLVTRPISPVILICFMLLLIFYPRFCEHSFLVDLTCVLSLFISFYFYRVEGDLVLRH